jgi:uncharacterized protein with HEPN domain
MLESLLKIQKYTRDIQSTEELLEKEDQMVFNACLTLLANIGESINKLSDSAKAGIASENIQAIRGMRNRIVHDYTGLDSFVVYNTIKNDLDPLKDTFVKIIHEGLVNKSFDEGEFEAAKNSGFYKFIDFNIF